MTHDLPKQLKEAIEHEVSRAGGAAGSPGLEAQIARADVLVEVVQVVYDYVKTWHPGGEGLDGNDGPERRAIAKVLDEAKFYVDDLGVEQDRERGRGRA